MKRVLYLCIVCTLIFFLSGCFILREKIKEEPGEMTIPDDALMATCVFQESTFKYVYYLDGVYAFYIDDVKQNEKAVDELLELAYKYGQSVENYLFATYGEGVCEIVDYQDDES